MKQHTPFYRLLGITFLSSILLFSCEKTETTIPPELGNFLNKTNDTYFIVNPTDTYEIGVGVTTVSDKDRTIAFTVTSPTGATLGADYTLESPVVTIPAGQAVGKIVVKGNINSYQAGEKDTLVFTLQSPSSQGSSVAASEYNNVFRLLMRGPCFDGDVTLTDMAGDYTKTFENASYGPYTTTISGITQTSPTTGTATITNLYDFFGPITINFDWTDPNNTEVEIPLQITDQEYDTGQPFYVRTKPGESNKFSVCNQTFTFVLDVLVEISGTLYYYDNGVAYTMAR